MYVMDSIKWHTAGCLTPFEGDIWRLPCIRRALGWVIRERTTLFEQVFFGERIGERAIHLAP